MDPANRKSSRIVDLSQSYDEVPYPSLANPYTLISRMAAIGRIHGLTPPNPDNSTVLELGCADGGNLIAMACRFPQSQFMGVDFSAIQIETGRQTIRDMALTNLSLLHADILDLQPEDLAGFDYIIVHGVYSWVSSKVQEKILSICKDQLTPNGLAYIGYKTYPGWHAKQALRDILRYHTRHINKTIKKAEAAFALINMLPTPQELPGDPNARLTHQLRTDLQRMEDPLSYLVHEYLVDSNEPLYFSDFLTRIESVELAYVNDAFPGSAALERLLLNTQNWVSEVCHNDIEKQQYIDFLCNTSFRRSLLCRSTEQPDNQMSYNRLQSLYVTATCRQTESDDETLRFTTDSGRRLSIEHRELGTMLQRIVDAHPTSLAVSELLEDTDGSVSDQEAALMLCNLLFNSALEFTTHAHDCTPTIGERPYASKLVRFQCLKGLVTSGAHRPVRLENVFERRLLELLDGTRTIAEIVEAMRKKLRPDQHLDDDQWEMQVRKHLKLLRQLGLLSKN